MKKDCNLLFLGGDARQCAMIRELCRMGYQGAFWGITGAGEIAEMEEIPSIEALPEAIARADAVILPLPASSDGVNVFAPMRKELLRLDSLLPHLKGHICLGARIPGQFSEKAEGLGIHCIDYFPDECLQLKNALPTAEGAILLAMQALDTVLFDTPMAVIGYGRIGELLANRLRALGADVTVYARREEVLVKAAFSGCKTVCIKDADAALCGMDPETRVVFNTVPQILFDSVVLPRFPKRAIYVELASLPGGMDLAAAREYGIQTVLGSALPGKYAPESAGIYPAQTVDRLLKDHFDI